MKLQNLDLMVKEVTVIRSGDSRNIISITTTLPSPIGSSNKNLNLRFDCPSNMIEQVLATMGLKITNLIEVQSHMKFSDHDNGDVRQS